MSLFLGPVHHWPYHRIRLQKELVTALAKRENVRGGDSGRYETYANRELRPPKELIDTDNTHGWLQTHIHDVESRYAALVTVILKENNDAKSRIGDEVFAFDASNAVPTGASPAEAYCFYGDNLVSDMSYDHADRVTGQAEDHIAWILDQDLYGDFWTQAGQSPGLCHALRLTGMCSMLSGTRLELLSSSKMSYVLKERA